MTPLRRTATAALVLAALLAAACSRGEPPASAPVARTQPPPVIPPPPKAPPAFQRDHYARLDDCVYDWGAAQKCQPVPPATPLQQAGIAFVGPIYARGYREETQAQVRKEALDAGYAQSVAAEASNRASGQSEVRP